MKDEEIKNIRKKCYREIIPSSVKKCFNETLVGLRVRVSNDGDDWVGKINKSLDDEHFEIERNGKVVIVNIFDIEGTEKNS